MNANLSIYSPELSQERLAHATREMAKQLNQETQMQATQIDSAGAAGTRGDAVTLGTLALTFFTSGAAVAAIKVFESWFSRLPSLKLEFRRADGTSFVIQADNMKSEEIERTTEMAKQFFG